MLLDKKQREHRELHRTFEESLEEVKNLEISLQSANKVLKDERENCKFEVETLAAEWRGKNQLAVTEVEFSKEDTFDRLRSKLRKENAETERVLEPLHAKEKALEATIAGLMQKRVDVERDRVLGRWLEQTTPDYLTQLFGPMRRGEFKRLALDSRMNKPVFTQTAGNVQKDRQSKLGLWHVNRLGKRESIVGVTSDQIDAFAGVVPEKEVFGDEHFPRGGYWMSCAVVGSSGLLLKYFQGETIDRHDAVFRFDDDPTEGYEDHVGTKTTVRIVRDDKFDQATTFSSTHRREMILQHVDSIKTLAKFTAYRRDNMQSSFNLHALAPQFKEYLNRFVGVGIPHGFYGVVLAMQKCRKVDVYGFSSTLKMDMFKQRYYEEDESSISSQDSEEQPFPGMNVQEFNLVLTSELSNRLLGEDGTKVVEMSEPCQSLEQTFGVCKDKCSAIALSPGGECIEHVPIPVSKRGFCSPTPATRANCFLKCDETEENEEEACKGGFGAAPCKKKEKGSSQDALCI